MGHIRRPCFTFFSIFNFNFIYLNSSCVLHFFCGFCLGLSVVFLSLLLHLVEIIFCQKFKILYVNFNSVCLTCNSFCGLGSNFKHAKEIGPSVGIWWTWLRVWQIKFDLQVMWASYDEGVYILKYRFTQVPWHEVGPCSNTNLEIIRRALKSLEETEQTKLSKAALKSQLAGLGVECQDWEVNMGVVLVLLQHQLLQPTL